MATIEHEIRLHDTGFEAIINNLKAILDVIENCGETYRHADDATKHLMNQAIFERFLVGNDIENGIKVHFKLAAPFAQLEEPIKDDLAKLNHATPERARTLIDTIKAHSRAYFGGGLSDDIFSANSSSKDKNLMVSSKLEKSDNDNTDSPERQDADKSAARKNQHRISQMLIFLINPRL